MWDTRLKAFLTVAMVCTSGPSVGEVDIPETVESESIEHLEAISSIVRRKLECSKASAPWLVAHSLLALGDYKLLGGEGRASGVSSYLLLECSGRDSKLLFRNMGDVRAIPHALMVFTDPTPALTYQDHVNQMAFVVLQARALSGRSHLRDPSVYEQVIAGVLLEDVRLDTEMSWTLGAMAAAGSFAGRDNEDLAAALPAVLEAVLAHDHKILACGGLHQSYALASMITSVVSQKLSQERRNEVMSILHGRVNDAISNLDLNLESGVLLTDSEMAILGHHLEWLAVFGAIDDAAFMAAEKIACKLEEYILISRDQRLLKHQFGPLSHAVHGLRVFGVSKMNRDKNL